MGGVSCLLYTEVVGVFEHRPPKHPSFESGLLVSAGRGFSPQ